MADDTNLQLVISAEDEASPVVFWLAQSIEKMGAAAEESATATDESAASLKILADSANGAYTAQNKLMDASIAIAMATQQQANSAGTLVASQQAQAESAANVAAADEAASEAAMEMAAAEEEESVASDESAASHDVLASSIEKMGVRFIAHALIIGSVIAAYTYLKNGVEDAEKAGTTFAAKMNEVNKAGTDLQATIGEALAPAIVTFGDALIQSDQDTTKNTQSMSDFGHKAFEASNYILAFGQGILAAVDVGITGLENLKDVFVGAYDEITGKTAAAKAATDDYNNNLKTLQTQLDAAADSAKKYVEAAQSPEAYANAVKEAGDFNNKLLDTNKAADAAAQKLTTATQTMKDDYSTLSSKVTEDLTNLSTTHDTAVQSMDASLDDLTTKYNDTATEGAAALSALAKSNTSAMDSINSSITSVKNNIDTLNTAFASTQSGNTDTLVQAFAKAQEDVTSLTAAIADPSTSASTVTTDKTQLAQTQATLASNADLVTQYQDQITAQEKFDGEGALQQAIDTFNLKQQQDQTAYNTKLAQYQGEEDALDAKSALEMQDYNANVAHTTQEYNQKLQTITDEISKVKDQIAQENQLYLAKADALIKIQDDAETAIQNANTETKNLTIKNVDEEIAAYKELAATMTAVDSAKSVSAIQPLPTPSVHLADGGIVSQPTVALIGEDGPEAVVPLDNNANVQQLPANGPAAGGNNAPIVNLYITAQGTIVTQNDLLDFLGDGLTQLLKLNFATV